MQNSIILLVPGLVITAALFFIFKRRLAWTYSEIAALAAPSLIYFVLSNYCTPLALKSLGNILEFFAIGLSAPIYLAVRSELFPGALRSSTRVWILGAALLLPFLVYFGTPSLPE
jgi:hypothetical protein